MNLLTVNYCRQLRCNLYSSFIHTIRQYNTVSDTAERNVSKTMKSIKYPEYKIIYSFPYILPAYILNKMKRNFTVAFGASVPITATAQMFNVMTMADCVFFLCSSCLLNLSLHIGCHLCNNMIGSIYFKEDNQDVIISYISYWGRRTDLKTNMNSITPLTETPLNSWHKLYRYLFVESCDQKLKLFLKHGKTIDKPDFDKVFGNFN